MLKEKPVGHNTKYKKKLLKPKQFTGDFEVASIIRKAGKERSLGALLIPIFQNS